MSRGVRQRKVGKKGRSASGYAGPSLVAVSLMKKGIKIGSKHFLPAITFTGAIPLST